MKEKRYYEWISVKDELPEYEEEVIVCNEKEPSFKWFTWRSSAPNMRVNGCDFVDFFRDDITHWMRIQQLNEK